MYYWLLLIPAFILSGWYFPGLRLQSPLRALALLCLTLALVNPAIPMRSPDFTLAVLLDRSASHNDTVETSLAEWRKLIGDARPSSGARVDFYEFAGEVVPASENNAATIYPERRGQTRLADAIQYLLGKSGSETPARILVLTDGFSTQSLAAVSRNLAARGISLDCRLTANPRLDDARVSRFELPESVQPGQTFPIVIECMGPLGEKTLHLQLRRNNAVLGDFEVPMRNGRGMVALSDTIPESSLFCYSVNIIRAKDPIVANNTATAWVNAIGGPRVLVVSPYADDPLVPVIGAQGVDVLHITDPARLDPAMLTHTRAVVFNNMPAPKIPAVFMRAIPFYVNQQGGGFMMTGGRGSFASGGYYASEIDPVLPVSLTTKVDTYRNSVGLGVVLDCSGSMGATVAGGLMKMDLANNGAVAAMNELGPMDTLAVSAVDSSTTQVVPLVAVKDHPKAGLARKIRSIAVGGGGIYCYTGIKDMYEVLRKAPQRTRHIILFADAADAEEPGEYVKLLEEMSREGIRVSVIGLGTDKDCDAGFLSDLAARGGGNIYFSERAEDIPKMFAQETATIARSVFLRDSEPVQATGLWREISSGAMTWPAQISGINVCYPRPGSTSGLLLDTDEHNPLVSWAHRGLGRSAAISFAVAGEHAKSTLAWPGYSRMINSLVQWISGSPVPPGIGLRHRLTGNTLNVDLFYDAETWGDKFVSGAPSLKLSTNAGVIDVTWQKIASGQFSASVDIAAYPEVYGVVQIPGHALPFGPIAPVISPEWNFENSRLDDLRQAVAVSGGRMISDFAEVWKLPEEKQPIALAPYFLVALLALVLADALVTRLQLAAVFSAWNAFVWRMASRIRGSSRKPARASERMTGRGGARRRSVGLVARWFASARKQGDAGAASAEADPARKNGEAGTTGEQSGEKRAEDDNEMRRRSRFNQAKR